MNKCSQPIYANSVKFSQHRVGGGDDWQRHVLPCCHVLCIFLQNREDLKCKNVETPSNFVCSRKVDNYVSKGTLKYLSSQAKAVA